MAHPLLIFSQSEYLIQVVGIFHILNDKQCRSRSDGFFRSQLIWIYTVCKGRTYPGSAGQGLKVLRVDLGCPFSISSWHPGSGFSPEVLHSFYLRRVYQTFWQHDHPILALWASEEYVCYASSLYKTSVSGLVLPQSWSLVSSCSFLRQLVWQWLRLSAWCW